MATSYIENMSIPKMEKTMTSITWNELRKAGRQFPIPFQIVLADNVIPLECDEMVRVIPRNRVVVFGTWDGVPIVAKLFFAPGKAKQHLIRDVEGVEALVNANIPTPKLLYTGHAKDKRIQVLIFERILESNNLDVIWQKKSNVEEVLALMRQVVIELATQHVLGIVQRDLHLKNFLITQKQIYTLDGGSIDQFDGILSKEESLKHLALFFAQLGVGKERLLQDLFDVYTKARGWIIKKADIDTLHNAIEKWNKIRWERYEKKIFRHCTAFAETRCSGSYILYDREYASDEFLQFLKNPDPIFVVPATEMLKKGGSSTVAKVKVDNRILVIKRFNIKSAGHWLRRCLRPTRAAAAWRLGHYLRLFGLPTAKPIACIETRFLGFRSKSYLIMECVNGPHLGEYFTKNRDDAKRLSTIADRVMMLLKNVAKLKMTHGDLKMTNILIENDKPVLIDLDGVTEHKTYYGLKRAWKHEINRFMKNWDNLPKIQALFARILK